MRKGFRTPPRSHAPRVHGISAAPQNMFVVKIEVSIMRATKYPTGEVKARDNVVGTFSGDGHDLLAVAEEYMVDACEFINQRAGDGRRQVVVVLEDDRDDGSDGGDEDEQEDVSGPDPGLDE